MPEPLTGIRVVEITAALQGPGAGLYLSDMGAEVIKIEPPSGEAARYHRGVRNTLEADAMGSLFIASNRGKKSMSFDLRSDAGREIVRRLAERSDVFLSNFRESALDRLGIGYRDLRERNPRIIYALANGAGPRGPYADKAMVDGAAQARGGLMTLTGDPDAPPTLVGPAMADATGAMQLALGVVTALLARERHGVGQRVDTSLLGGQLWLQQWEIAQSSTTGNPLVRQGPHHPNVAGMYGVYETADGGHIMFAFPMSEESWQAFCAFAGFPELAKDERWNSVQKRLGLVDPDEGKTAAEIRRALRQGFKSKTTGDWVEFLDGQPEIVYNKVCDHREVLEDPQALANGYLVEMELASIGRAKLVGSTVALSETPGSAKGPPPELGQHTEEVLLELGYSWEEIGAINAHTKESLRRAFERAGVEPPS